MPSLYCWPAFRRAQAAGSSLELWVSGPNSSAGNVSLTAANGDFWYAVEFVLTATPTEPVLQLGWYEPTPGYWSFKNLQLTGTLTGSGIYPSILTWGGAANVFVVGKLNPTGLGTAPHLRVYTQDRDNLLAATSTERVRHEGDFATENVVRRRSRRIFLSEGQMLFRKRPVPKEVRNRTLRPVSDVANDTEDHAMSDFTGSGRRYTVYHRDSTLDIWVEITTCDGTTWTPVAEFGLTGSEGFDFPSIFIRNNGSDSEIAIAAHKTSTGNTALWKCGPAPSASCDSALEIGATQANTTGGNRLFPQVFITPRSSTTDTFIVVENDVGGTVRIMSVCGGSGSIDDTEGSLPVPAVGYTCGPEQQMGADAFWAHRQVVWDGTQFHVAHLVENCDELGRNNVLLYSAAPSDLCP